MTEVYPPAGVKTHVRETKGDPRYAICGQRLARQVGTLHRVTLNLEVVTCTWCLRNSPQETLF